MTKTHGQPPNVQCKRCGSPVPPNCITHAWRDRISIRCKCGYSGRGVPVLPVDDLTIMQDRFNLAYYVFYM